MTKLVQHVSTHLLAYTIGLSTAIVSTALAGLFYTSPIDTHSDKIDSENAWKKEKNSWKVKRTPFIRDDHREDDETTPLPEDRLADGGL
ncbi:hypothetical protein PROFUN_00355 [Planoprotostelium fungivorum]|uniref:Uncharacterized protein n=1 Tax=Planoprotostelium fungivorum TaxID=1890364 RepID=A0A2P6NY53_9EUKA|nr:hypothetical protein PROFUN_00355 [Planoprotostelium fungivorum]